MTREPSFDELVGGEQAGAERERLRGAHELLLRAGPPPELTPRLEAGPNLGIVRQRQQRRRMMKRRALVLLAAALSIVVVFAAGYAVANQRSGSGGGTLASIKLQGTSAAPDARATLEVWDQQAGNWPMTLNVSGLPPHARYEVYLVRGGKPWGSCGTFRVTGSSDTLTLKLNAPYELRNGDSWVVTRLVPGAGEPGKTVLRPVSA